MRLSEIFRLVWLNLSQNKFKVILTSIGIIVGSATIMMVIAIGTGGKEEVAEQFRNLSAGAIDISYETSSADNAMSGMFPAGGATISFTSVAIPQPSGGGRGGDSGRDNFFFGSQGEEKSNEEKLVLSKEDAQDIEVFVPDISEATISYTTNKSVEGGSLDAAANYTIGGVKSNYAGISNLEMLIGDFLTEENDDGKEKVCVLGYTAAKQIFGSAYDAYDSVIYIDGRPYVVAGVLNEMGTVASGINPDTTVFIPYQTGIKYITGSSISPTITVVAEDVGKVEDVIANIRTVLGDSYPNADFTISDAGSKMEAASASNETLTLLLVAMAVIVFLVGGIGIMNVLFVSVKERTNEIGILKAIGCTRKDILLEFLFEAACISMIGAVIGVLLSLGLTPIIERFSVRVELSMAGGIVSLLFGVLTGSLFGFYPAYKASTLVPVAALNQE